MWSESSNEKIINRISIFEMWNQAIYQKFIDSIQSNYPHKKYTHKMKRTERFIILNQQLLKLNVIEVSI